MSHNWLLKLFIISFILVSSSDCCMNKFREIHRKIQNRGRVEKSTTAQPAVLYKEPDSAFANYANHAGADFYIELEEDGNGNVRILSSERLPPILDQKRDPNATQPLNITLTFLAENVTAKTKIPQINETNNIDYEAEPAIEAGTKSDDDNSELNSTTTTEATKPAAANGDEGDEEILTEADISVRLEWGGTCTAKHWNKCNRVQRILVPFVKPTDPKKLVRWLDIDCSFEKIMCMRNGWTINRCHMVCMSKCNKEMQDEGGWEKYVSLEGECPY